MVEADDEILQVEMDMVNGSIQSQWDDFQKTAQERAAATHALGRLEALDSAGEPDKVDIKEVKAARRDLYKLAKSRDPEAAQMILKQFVVELTADSKKKTVEGILLDPRLFDTRYLAAPRGDGGSRTAYVRLYAKYLGNGKFRVKTCAA